MTNAFKIEFGFGAGEDRDRKSISDFTLTEAMGCIKRAAIRNFDGCTITATEGGWRNPAGSLVEERGFTLTVYTSRETRKPVADMVTAIKAALRQEAVCVIQTPVNFEVL